MIKYIILSFIFVISGCATNQDFKTLQKEHDLLTVSFIELQTKCEHLNHKVENNSLNIDYIEKEQGILQGEYDSLYMKIDRLFSINKIR